MYAQTLAASGAKVYIGGRRMEVLQKSAEVHGKDIAGQLIPIQLDITDKASIQAAVKELASKEKHLNLLVNK